MKFKNMDQFALPLRSWVWMSMSLSLAAVAWTCAEKWSLPSEASANSRLRPRFQSLGAIDSASPKPWLRADELAGVHGEEPAEHVERKLWEKKQRIATRDAADAMMAESNALDWAAKQSVKLVSNKAAGPGARELVVVAMGPEGPLRCELRYEWVGDRQAMYLARRDCAPKPAEGKARR